MSGIDFSWKFLDVKGIPRLMMRYYMFNPKLMGWFQAQKRNYTFINIGEGWTYALETPAEMDWHEVEPYLAKKEEQGHNYARNFLPLVTHYEVSQYPPVDKKSLNGFHVQQSNGISSIAGVSNWTLTDNNYLLHRIRHCYQHARDFMDERRDDYIELETLRAKLRDRLIDRAEEPKARERWESLRDELNRNGVENFKEPPFIL